MLKNYFITGLRNLMRNKFFSFINIFGLSAGITCCLLISIYVKHELSYENFHKKGDRITRVIMEYGMGGNTNKGNYTSTYVGPSFKKNFPEVADFVRMAASKKIVKYREKLFVEKRLVYADSNFFKLFDFKLVEGVANAALSGPNKLVLTRGAAKKYFNTEDPIGKTMKVTSAGTDYLVTAVVEDCPENSHIKFDLLASFSSLGITPEEIYWNANYTTYFLLKDPSSITTLQEKIPGFMKKEMKDDFTNGDYLTYHLEPLRKIHLYSDFPGFESTGSIQSVYILSAVALLILAIACFTFVNLSTAKSVERAKEIGIRKVTGASKTQIFWQFIGESVFIILLSTFTSIILSGLFLPYFNDLMVRKITLSELFSLPLLSYCLVLIVVISFFAGSYPALVLSGFQPIKVLKGAFKNSGSGLMVRKSLFVFQFVVSVFLVICAIIIQNQLHFIQNTKLGFDRRHVLILPYDSKIHEKYSSLKTLLKQNPHVVSVSRGDFKPCNIIGGYSMQKPEMLPDKSYAVNAGTIDNEYLKTCGIKLIAGSNIDEKDIQEVNPEKDKQPYFNFLLNQTAVKQMGWTVEEAIGKKMFLDESRPGIVKGVMEDFHFATLHEPIKPLVLFPGGYGNEIFVKLSGMDLGNTLSGIEKTWKGLLTHRPFEYTFLDENYKSMYDSEITLGKSMNVFTLIAIILACLGLFGLSSYNIQQRTKEIGILKVLGAPIITIMVKLTKNFLLLVTIAICISIPLAWLVMTIWLEDFVYRTPLNFSVFLFSAIASLFIAFITLSFKAIKAARENPVKSLRTE
jgi:putative ABC transport system permease protein